MAHLNLCTLFAATLPAVCDVRTLIYIKAAEITLSAHLQMNISGKLDTIDFDNIEEVEVHCLE